MNTPGHSRLRHEVSTERRRIVVRALAEGRETIEQVAEHIGMTDQEVRHLMYSLVYHFRVATNHIRGKRGRVARYRLSVPLDAALDVMGGADTTSARDAFYALEQAMPRPAAIAQTLALQVTPRRVELGIAP